MKDSAGRTQAGERAQQGVEIRTGHRRGNIQRLPGKRPWPFSLPSEDSVFRCAIVAVCGDPDLPQIAPVRDPKNGSITTFEKGRWDALVLGS